MWSTNWEQIANIIGTARELPPEHREAFLAQACGGDDVMLNEVRSLLTGADAFPSVLGISPFPDSGIIDMSEIPTVSSIDFNRPDKLIGQVLDARFLIEMNLAEAGADIGGMGVIYRAKNLNLEGKDVVVKILQKASLENSESLRKFKHEKEALIRLNHPNIVSILYSGELDDGNPFMVMEYISGYSLRTLLGKGRVLPFDLVAHIIDSVTSGLSAAHGEKILHRDLKPENIMLTPQEGGFDHVKLIDFGIARVAESRLATETLIASGAGTLRYMAPEQLAGHLKQTPAIDIYALSIVIYEMLTGYIPFRPVSDSLTEQVIETYEMHKKGVQVMPRTLCPELSPSAEKLLLSGFEYDPERRPQDARKFGRDLAGALHESLKVSIPATNEAELASTVLVSPTRVETVDKEGYGSAATHTAAAIHTSASSRKPKRYPLWPALALLILIALAIPVGIAYWNGSKVASVSDKSATEMANSGNANAARTSETLAGTERTLSYFLKVQKMRDGKPFEAEFNSSGQEIFESGYKFRMNFQADTDGYIYVFNEGKDELGKTGYYLLFPTESRNKGSARVGKGQQIETASNEFNGGRGTEIMWLIWIKEKSAELEAIASSIVDPPGIVAATKTSALRSFLEKHQAAKPDSTKDSANQRTVVKAKGEVVVHRFELEHR